MMVTDEQKLLTEMYKLQDKLENLLVVHQMYEELTLLHSIIKKLEYNIINNVGSVGI